MPRHRLQGRPKGHPKTGGRQKGTRNKRTRLAETFAQGLLDEPGFQEALRAVMANPGHPQWRFTVEIVLHYAYGKPAEHIHQTSDGSLPNHQLQVAWISYDEFFNGNGDTPPAISTHATQLPMADYEGDDGRT